MHNVFVLLGLGGDSVGILSVELEGEGETQINVNLNVLYRLAPSRSGRDGVLVVVRASNGYNSNTMPKCEHARASVIEYTRNIGDSEPLGTEPLIRKTESRVTVTNLSSSRPCHSFACHLLAASPSIK